MSFYIHGASETFDALYIGTRCSNFPEDDSRKRFRESLSYVKCRLTVYIFSKNEYVKSRLLVRI